MESSGGVYVVEFIVPYQAYIGVCRKTQWKPNLPIRWCGTEGNEVVLEGRSEPLVVLTIKDILIFALGRAMIRSTTPAFTFMC